MSQSAMERLKVTEELLAAGASRRGGFSKRQVVLLGVTWPLQRGWKQSIIGSDISAEAATEFVNLSDQHLIDEKKKSLNWCGAIEPVTTYLYVLALNDNCFYVGLTQDIDKRMGQHFSGTGAEWTKLHPPIRLLHVVCTGTQDARKAEQMENEATVALMIDCGIERVRGGNFCNIEQGIIEAELRKRGMWERIKKVVLDRHAFETEGSWDDALENFLVTALRYYDAGASDDQIDAVFSAGYSLTRYRYWHDDFMPGLSWQFWNSKGILPVLLSFKLGRPVASRLSSSYEILAAALSRGRNGKHPLRRIFLLAWQAYLPLTTHNQTATVARFMDYLNCDEEHDHQYDAFITILFPELRHLFRQSS